MDKQASYDIYSEQDKWRNTQTKTLKITLVNTKTVQFRVCELEEKYMQTSDRKLLWLT